MWYGGPPITLRESVQESHLGREARQQSEKGVICIESENREIGMRTESGISKRQISLHNDQGLVNDQVGPVLVVFHPFLRFINDRLIFRKRCMVNC